MISNEKLIIPMAYMERLNIHVLAHQRNGIRNKLNMFFCFIPMAIYGQAITEWTFLILIVYIIGDGLNREFLMISECPPLFLLLR